MSLTIASPSTRNRVAPRVRSGRSEVSRGRPPLRVVRDHDPVAGVRGTGPAPRRHGRSSSPRPRPPVRREHGRPAPLRLTRRGRLVVRAGGALLAVTAVLAGVLLADRPAEAGSVAHQVPVSYHVVLPGETLWEIAGVVAPNADRRDTVADIIELNALPGAAVQAGLRLALPR